MREAVIKLAMNVMDQIQIHATVVLRDISYIMECALKIQVAQIIVRCVKL